MATTGYYLTGPGPLMRERIFLCHFVDFCKAYDDMVRHDLPACGMLS
jgi:hypothetical protein